MKKILAIIMFSLIGATSFLMVPATNATYDNFPPGNEQSHPRHPDYYDGNLRSKLKKRADIERASKSNLHYDEYARDYYRCNWIYNKNLGTWVCDKSYGKSYSSARPVAVCPFGYTKHPIQHTCVPIRMPANAHLNRQGTGWQCDAGYRLNYPRTGCDRNIVSYVTQSKPEYEITRYVHYYGNEEVSLPQTGPGFGLMLLVSGLIGYRIVSRKDNLN